MTEPERVLLADLRRLATAVDPPPSTRRRRPAAVDPPPACVVTGVAAWSDSASDPLADMRALAARLETLPFRRVEPVIVSPRHHELYQQELARLDAQAKLDRFHREIAWRRLRAKRLTPMYTAYRRRARRRNRR